MTRTEEIVSQTMNLLESEYDADLKSFGAETAKEIAAKIEKMQKWRSRPDECVSRQCSYYLHYLVWYDSTKAGEKLPHESFHQAEKHCEAAQKRVLDWYDQNAGNRKEIPESYERQASYWERRICA